MATTVINAIYLISAQFLGFKLRIIGLSGQICSGKTTAAEYLHLKHDATIIDYTEILTNILKRPDVRVIIKKDFGDSLFKNIKTLEYNEEEFKKFIHSNNINKIGYIINKYVIQDILLRVLQEKIYFNTKYVILENTFLMRNSFLKYICFPVLSICTDQIGHAPVIRRVMNKYNCDREEAMSVYLANQPGLMEYKVLSDFIIYNDQDIDKLKENLENFVVTNLKNY